MAARTVKVLSCVLKNNGNAFAGKKSSFTLSNILYIPARQRVTTDTGAFLPEPKKTPFGLLRVMLTVLPGLYLGATISKEGAAFLEENDIFVPDEDDDED